VKYATRQQGQAMTLEQVKRSGAEPSIEREGRDGGRGRQRLGVSPLFDGGDAAKKGKERKSGNAQKGEEQVLWGMGLYAKWFVHRRCRRVGMHLMKL